MKIKLLFFTIFLCAVSSAFAQTPCRPPEVVFNKGAYNIFSEEQEMYLGEAIAETLEKNFRVIKDEEANRYLQKVGAKLVEHLPPTNLKFQFQIIDTPELNAFTTAGGRIYVTRKMVAFLRSESELAGILGHELGHAVVRHTAIDISKQFKEILRAEKLGDREDIYRKYNELIDKANTKRVNVSRGHEDNQQLEADQIGVFSMVAAGYDPQGFSSAWNRLTEIEGKTGNSFTDLLGSTRPEEKRLREILNAIKTIPSECVDKNISASKEFEQWQTYIVTTSEFARQEKLTAVVDKKTLSPYLRGDILHFQFSPDGQHIIAQDSSGINFLKRDPFSFVFRINATDAKNASFSPDSQHITFQTYGLRVEKWNIREQKPVLAREVFVRDDCWKSAISPDGETLVCYSRMGNLDVINVNTNERIFREEKFYLPSYIDFYTWIYDIGENETREIQQIQIEFSPNGRYLLAGKVTRFRNDGNKSGGFSLPWYYITDIQSPYLAYDLQTKEKIKLGAKLKEVLRVPFAFYSNDQIIGQDAGDPKDSGTFSFPDGRRVDKFLMRANNFSRPHNNNLIIVRPTTTNPVGLYDTKNGKFIASNKTPAMDAYGEYLVSESREGYIGLFKMADNFQKLEEIGYVTIPKNKLGDIKSVAVSADFKWMAMSDKSRGAVWNLKTGEMKVYARGFRGSHFDANGNVYADFARQGEEERTMGMMDTTSGTAVKMDSIETPNTTQEGKFLVRLKTRNEEKIADGEKKAKDKKVGYEDAEDRKTFPRMKTVNGYLSQIDFGGEIQKDATLEIYDSASRKMLWSKNFSDEVPAYEFNPADETITLFWSMKTKAAKKEINSDSGLSQKAKALGEKDSDYMVRVLDANTGNIIGQAVIETGEGSFRVRRASATSKWITIVDTRNRVQLYSLAGGERRWQFFGDDAVINPVKSLAAVKNMAGQLAIYDLDSGKKLNELLFTNAVIYAQFSRDGNRLFVLTANQNYYFFDSDKLVLKK